MRDTIKQLVLSRRGRLYTSGYCSNSKWDLPNTEWQEENLGEIYRLTMKLPEYFREKIFDWSPEIHKIARQYVQEKNKTAVSLISPNISTTDSQLVWMTAYDTLRFSPQENQELEEVRREMVFAQAVDAFLRHL